MKKTFIFIAMISLLMVSVLFSCKKEMEPTEQISEQGVEYTEFELKLARQLKHFKSQLESPFKSEYTLEVDSARWYLETLFNVQMSADVNFSFVRTYEQSYSLNLGLNGKVSMADLADVYEAMALDLQAELDLLESEEKGLVLVILRYETLKSGSITMNLTGGVGKNPLNYYQEITQDDNWYYGNMLGRCDETYQWVSDAGRELMRRFNNPTGIGIPAPPIKWLYPQSSEILSNEEFPSRIFSEVSATPPCITYEDMQHYLVEGHYIIYNTDDDPNNVGVRPDGLTFNSMALWTNDANPPDNKYWHKYQILYGIPVSVPPID